MAAHEAAEGFRLVPAAGETVVRGSRCASGASVRTFDVAAINVDITLNRYLDHDPQGRMYVLERDLARVRDEEARNAAARSGNGEPAVTAGLQGDAIQPLTLRVNQGDCVRITLRDALANNEPASLHIHGSSLRVLGVAHPEPAVARNRHALATPAHPVTYEWMVDDATPEGVHYFHSHGDDRMQTNHGLFGAVVVEPRGSHFLDASTGQEATTGWEAVIKRADGTSFREFTLYYHEIGTEAYQVTNRTGDFVPLVDPLLGAYRPGSRALNYRSEPFMNRMALQKQRLGRFDESVAYSSYAFGDPATPIMRSYVGEPVKQRLVHAGSEVFHVHHLHGGAVRWRRQPDVASTTSKAGLDKHPPLLPGQSERIDSQALGPSETFVAENECGSGGCQQSVGDFLYHCHVAQHYFAGMWGIWRVYDTLQNGGASTDALPALPALDPSARDAPVPAVTSDHLRAAVGGDAAVRRQLPPPGTPHGYDAAVLDWQPGSASVPARNEPETSDVWPGYRSRAPGTRPPLLFNPRTGRLAYPFLHPHLGARPPFAPHHGPAPYLDPPANADPTAPGADGPASLCPQGTRLRSLAINAITLPVPINQRADIVDPTGEIYVLRGDEDAVRADPSKRRPLAIRANASQDCIDVLFRNELHDDAINHSFAKADVHIHFVQFDVQASDGVVTGFNYEQSVRPYAIEGEQLRGAVPAGATVVPLSATDRFQPGIDIGVGLERDSEFEVRTIVSVSPTAITLDRPLAHAHAINETVSTEYVRYRWYPDVQFGTAYFHDHVNALASWRHGLFGALISEPPQSTFHDPVTGNEITSGAIADIHAPADAPVSADIKGSFREMVMFIADDNPLTSIGRSTGSSLNLRAEPLTERGRDPTRVFSSTGGAGDPETAVLRAYLGDPIVVRNLVAGTNDVHTWHIDGHWFRAEPWSTSSPPISTINVGISERYDLSIARAGGPQQRPGDYLFENGRSFKLREGSWGLLRVLGTTDASLHTLPGHDTVPAPRASGCPAHAPTRHVVVSAIDAPLPMLDGASGKVFVLGNRGSAGAPPPAANDVAPLVLHASVGDCVVVRLVNRTSGPVSLHADLLAADPMTSGGIAAGNDPEQFAAPDGGEHTYTFFASLEVGPGAALLRDGADPAHNPGLGLYGAIVVAPRGSTFTDAITGDNAANTSSWRVDVHPPNAPTYRDFALFMQDEDAGIGSHRMPYAERVTGTAAINYRVAPDTPKLEAVAGDHAQVHVLVPWSEQTQVFSVEGHTWPFEPGEPGTSQQSSTAVGGLDVANLMLDDGAGGRGRLAGSYEYGDHRLPYRDAGLFGTFVVHACNERHVNLKRIASSCSSGSIPSGSHGALIGATLVLILTGLAIARRRRTESLPIDRDEVR